MFVILKLVYRTITFYNFYSLILACFALLKHSKFSTAPVKGVFEFLSNKVEMPSLFFFLRYTYAIYWNVSGSFYNNDFARAPNTTSILLWTAAAVSRTISNRSCSADAKVRVRLIRNVQWTITVQFPERFFCARSKCVMRSKYGRRVRFDKLQRVKLMVPIALKKINYIFSEKTHGSFDTHTCIHRQRYRQIGETVRFCRGNKTDSHTDANRLLFFF